MTNSAASATDAGLRASVSQLSDPASAWIRAAALTAAVAIPLVVNPFGPDAYAAAKVQVLYGLVGSMLVAWAIRSISDQRVQRGPAQRVTALEVGVWVFWLAVLLSSIVSANLRLTILGAPGRYEGVLAVTTYVVLFFVGTQFFGSSSGLRQIARSIAAGAAVVIVYGLAQILLPPSFEGEGIIRSWYGSVGLPRIFSTLGSPIVLGGYLALTVPLVLALALAEDRPRAVWLAVAAAGMVAAVFTYSRAAWVALVVAIVVFFGLTGPAVWRRHGRALLTAAAASVVVLTLFLIRTGGTAPVTSRAASALVVQAGSAGQRVYIWTQTLGLIRQRPLLGWGLETLREVFPYDRPALEKYFGLRPVIIDKAHNDILQVAVSIGLPGAAAYVAIWLLVLLGAYRLWRREEGSSRVLAAGGVAAFVGYIVQAQFSFSTVALAPLAWLLAGAVSGWEAASAQRTQQ